MRRARVVGGVVFHTLILAMALAWALSVSVWLGVAFAVCLVVFGSPAPYFVRRRALREADPE